MECRLLRSAGLSFRLAWFVCLSCSVAAFLVGRMSPELCRSLTSLSSLHLQLIGIVCVMTNHHTFGAEVVSDDLKLDLNWKQLPEKLAVQAELHDFASLLILLMAFFWTIMLLTIAVGSVDLDYQASDACVLLCWRKLFQHCVSRKLDPVGGCMCLQSWCLFRHDEGLVAILLFDRSNCRWSKWHSLNFSL